METLQIFIDTVMQGLLTLTDNKDIWLPVFLALAIGMIYNMYLQSRQENRRGDGRIWRLSDGWRIYLVDFFTATIIFAALHYDHAVKPLIQDSLSAGVIAVFIPIAYFSFKKR